MAAGTYDIFSDRGETFTQTFQYLDENSNPISLSDYKLHFVVKTTTTTTDEHHFELYSEPNLTEEGTLPFVNTDTTEYGIIEKIVGSSSVGKFTIKIYTETMESLKRGYYYYTLRLIATDDSITPILKGRFTVQSEVE